MKSTPRCRNYYPYIGIYYYFPVNTVNLFGKKSIEGRFFTEKPEITNENIYRGIYRGIYRKIYREDLPEDLPRSRIEVDRYAVNQRE
jgi:hypothetical protein